MYTYINRYFIAFIAFSKKLYFQKNLFPKICISKVCIFKHSYFQKFAFSKNERKTFLLWILLSRSQIRFLWFILFLTILWFILFLTLYFRNFLINMDLWLSLYKTCNNSYSRNAQGNGKSSKEMHRCKRILSCKVITDWA